MLGYIGLLYKQPDPQVVQHFKTPSSVAGTADASPWAYWVNPTLTGNALSIWFQSDTSPTSCTVSDDAGNKKAATLVLTAGQKLWHVGFLGAAGGARKITFAFNSAPSFFSATGQELYGCAASGSVVYSAGVGTQTGTISAGAIGGSAGDVVIQFGLGDTATPVSSAITGWTNGSGYTRLSADRYDGIYVQWRKRPDGAHTPSFTVGGSTDNFPSAAACFPQGNSGQPRPNDCRIIGRHEYSVSSGISSTSLVFDVPCSGNALLAAWIGFRPAAPSTSYFTGFTDSGSSGTWGESGSPVLGSGVAGDTQHWGCRNITTPSDALTITGTLNNAQTNGSSLYVYDIANADPTNPFEKEGHNNGIQSVAGNLTTLSGFTPLSRNGVVIGTLGINSHATSGTLAPMQYDSPGFAAEDGGSNAIHQDNGWCHVYNVDLTGIDFIWTIQHNTAGVQDWTFKCTAIKPASYATPAASGNDDQSTFPKDPFHSFPRGS
jgi:hypothetical protein